jgi:signal transduction histidine kinase
MKFSFKVCLCTALVIAVVCSAGSYALITHTFAADIDREVKRGLEEYQLTQFAFASSLLSADLQFAKVSDDMLRYIITQTSSLTSGQNLAVYNKNGVRFAAVPESFALSLPVAAIQDYEQHYQITEGAGTYALEIAGGLTFNQQRYYLAISRDVTALFTQRQDLILFYISLNLAMITIGVLIMSGLAHVLTRPIRQLKRSAQRIADGRYSERSQVKTRDEIGALSLSFNHMAAAVESNMAEIRRYAQQQHDFVANFSHELKTPLTSIIGYADLLRSEQLEAKDAFKAASFIFSEGKRLEAMSLKLLEMTILEHQSFVLKPINIRPLLLHTAEVVAPSLAQAALRLEWSAEKRIVLGEPDLLVTLLINLIDNGRKASAEGKIILSGRSEGQQYRIFVQDFGCGIDQTQLQRITEAFYRVDKARARARDGAGLGLSIAARIAQIHHTELCFESSPMLGTTVSFSLPVYQDKQQTPTEEERA